MVRGFGLGLVFIPISTVAFAGLQGAEIAQGAARYNLMRQLGGSFGIAVLNTYIVKMTAYHRADLVSHLHPGDPLFQQRIHGAAGALMANGGYSLASAQAAALHLMDHLVQAQAMTMAYNNAFILLGLTFALALPAVLLLRRPSRGALMAAEAH